MSTNQSPTASTEAPPQAGVWTRFLPEAFGIREAVRNSPYRWCVRESFMWGIATGTAMGLHRLRMQTHPFWAVNAAFATCYLVSMPSYYFCYRTRQHKEKAIEMMMAANDFRPGEEMPPEMETGESHPFLDEASDDTLSVVKGKEFVAKLKERKEWQKPESMGQRDAAKVFKEVEK